MRKKNRCPASALATLIWVAALQGCASIRDQCFLNRYRSTSGGVLALMLAACTHAPVDIPLKPALPAVDESAQSTNFYGGAEEYGDREISFDFNQATLNSRAVSKLDEAVETMKKYPDLVVEVSGHADWRESHSQRLSLRRARAAYDYLISKGIEASRLLGPVGYGASRLIYVGEDNPEHRANRANRRIDLDVQL